MAGRFPLYADTDVRGPFIKALRDAGWDVVRAIDELIEGAEDLPHFERAVEQGRVLVSNDTGQETRAHQWYEEGRRFPGLIVWRQAVYGQITDGELIEAFERLARQDEPLASAAVIGCSRSQPTPPEVEAALRALLETVDQEAPGASLARLTEFRKKHSRYDVVTEIDGEIDHLRSVADGRYHEARELAREGDFGESPEITGRSPAPRHGSTSILAFAPRSSQLRRSWRRGPVACDGAKIAGRGAAAEAGSPRPS